MHRVSRVLAKIDLTGEFTYFCAILRSLPTSICSVYRDMSIEAGWLSASIGELSPACRPLPVAGGNFEIVFVVENLSRYCGDIPK